MGYSDSTCSECETELVQLAGDWLCPNCNDLEQFTLDGKDYDFAV